MLNKDTAVILNTVSKTRVVIWTQSQEVHNFHSREETQALKPLWKFIPEKPLCDGHSLWKRRCSVYENGWSQPARSFSQRPGLRDLHRARPAGRPLPAPAGTERGPGSLTARPRPSSCPRLSRPACWSRGGAPRAGGLCWRGPSGGGRAGRVEIRNRESRPSRQPRARRAVSGRTRIHAADPSQRRALLPGALRAQHLGAAPLSARMDRRRLPDGRHQVSHPTACPGGALPSAADLRRAAGVKGAPGSAPWCAEGLGGKGRECCCPWLWASWRHGRPGGRLGRGKAGWRVVLCAVRSPGVRTLWFLFSAPPQASVLRAGSAGYRGGAHRHHLLQRRGLRQVTSLLRWEVKNTRAEGFAPPKC